MSDGSMSWPQPFLNDVRKGMAAEQKYLPSQYFYDEKGSELFEQITRLPEYYPTRTEIHLLETERGSICETIGEHASIVEYGAGALRKIRLLLDGLKAPAAYCPVDVSGPFLRQASAELAKRYPDLDIRPVIGSFMQAELDIHHPEDAVAHIGFFPGSTLGNLEDDAVIVFLKQARSHLTKSPGFLLGLDINQDPATLIPAYNDKQGVTADFNLNVLARINRELDADFDLTGFRHDARWVAEYHRIEMHLLSQRAQSVTIAGETYEFAKGESIHTENSRKFTEEMLSNLAGQAGWQIARSWIAPGQTMALFWLV
jgi:dimethylhistidine N-methyltransferase